MSDRPHLIQLDPNEDATSVRDRLSFLRGRRVLLVWPERGTVLTRRLDLVLIQREAMRRVIRLALVTHDPQVRKHAAELNISAFETIGESEQKRWLRGRSKVFTKRHQKPDGTPDPEALQDVASRVKAQDDANPLRDNLIRGGVALALLGVIALVAYVVLPSATVTLTPQQSQIDVDVTITAAPDATDINIENRLIPMTVLRIETVQSGTVETNGTQETGVVRALGTVTFTNQTLGGVDVPEGTVVRTSSDPAISFRTVEDATVPAGSGNTADVSIEALQDFAGEVGNIPAGAINTVTGPLSDQLTVTNPEATFGGESETESVVSAGDVDRLESIVRQQVQSQAYTEMLPRLTDTQTVMLETLTIVEERDDWKTFSAAPGDAVETLSLQMRAVVQATVIDQQFAQTVVFAVLSQEKPRQLVIEPNSVNYTLGQVTDVTPGGGVTFTMQASARIVEPVNAGQLSQQIAGRPLQQAFDILTTQVDLQPDTAPQISLSPGWVRRLPVLPMRIQIQIEEITS